MLGETLWNSGELIQTPHSGRSIIMDAIIIRSMRKNRERGSVLIICALSVLALMGLAALVIDLGAIHTAHAQLKIGADAAALAAVQE